MYQTHAKKDDSIVVLKLDPTRIAKGHVAHRSGSGRHADRRTKRNRTRSQQNRTALSGD